MNIKTPRIHTIAVAGSLALAAAALPSVAGAATISSEGGALLARASSARISAGPRARGPARTGSARRPGGRRARAGRARRARRRSRRARRAGARGCARRRGRAPARCSSSASASASIPCTGWTEETASTGAPSPSARSAARRSRTARSAIVPEVGLGDDEHVGHLHDPGLEELEHVAGAGLHDDRDGVGHLGHLGLGLPDADGLDDHDVERRGERLRRGARRGREAAEPLARRHRADEQPAVGGVGVDPRAVAQQRAARALRRRVDGEHARPSARARATRARARSAASTCRRPAGR